MKKQLIKIYESGRVGTQAQSCALSPSYSFKQMGYFLRMVLGDVSGTIKGILWDTAQ